MKEISTLFFLAILLSFCGKKEKLEKEKTTLVVNFDSEIKSINEGDSIRFNNLSKSSSSDVRYEWTFIGGTPSKSEQQNPVVRYNTFGDYDVKLVVISNNKKDSLIHSSYINVKTSPRRDTIQVKFESRNNIIFEDESVSFLNLSQSSNEQVKYNWTFVGGVPSKSSQKNPSVKYDKSGDYDVKLVVISNNKKDSLTSTAFVRVKSSLTKGLRLFYPLNGDVRDHSGNNIHGSVSSSAFLTQGKADNEETAYQFTGTANSFIEIPTEKLELDTFSYCMWVYLDELPPQGHQYMPFAIGNTGGDQHIQAMNYVSDGHGWAVGGYNRNYPSFFKSSRKTLEAKKWYLIVAVRTNNRLSLYVDCNLIAEDSSKNTVLPSYSLNPTIARLGGRYDGTFPLKGRIDEFRIYDRALTTTDIAKLCEIGPLLPGIIK